MFLVIFFLPGFFIDFLNIVHLLLTQVKGRDFKPRNECWSVKFPYIKGCFSAKDNVHIDTEAQLYLTFVRRCSLMPRLLRSFKKKKYRGKVTRRVQNPQSSAQNASTLNRVYKTVHVWWSFSVNGGWKLNDIQNDCWSFCHFRDVTWKSHHYICVINNYFFDWFFKVAIRCNKSITEKSCKTDIMLHYCKWRKCDVTIRKCILTVGC